MIPAILGKKLGMTQIFDEAGRRVPVTIIQAGPCRVLQLKTRARDGYAAVQLGFEAMKEKAAKKPLLGHCAKVDCPPQRFIREVRLADDEAALTAGGEVRVEILKETPLVDVQGTSKGKGFAGGMKLWHHHGLRASHGVSKHHRSSGTLGRHNSCQGKGVPKGKHMAGHMGDEQVTAIGLRVVRVDPERNLLLVKGAVPGANGGFLFIRESKRMNKVVRARRAEAITAATAATIAKKATVGRGKAAPKKK